MQSEMIEIIQDYMRTKPVDKAWIFGSFSRGEERPDSDVDIIVALTPGVQMGLGWVGMMCDLEDRLGRSVDMVREGCLMSFARENAEHDKILVYERTS